MPRKANPYLRVTEVCSFIDAEWYKYWVKSVGIDECERISKQSAEFGTGVHKLVEDYLREIETPPIYSDRQKFCADLIINWCKQSNIKPLIVEGKPAIELELISEQYKLKGHPDLIATFGDEPTIWVIDWKTSKEARRSYILQMAAYAKMLKEQYGFEANVGAILRVPSDPNTEKQFEAHVVRDLQTKWWPMFHEALDLVKFFKKKDPYKEVWDK